MRQAAWLAAAPEKANPHDKAEPVTRLKAMKDRGESPLWPDNPAPYLTDWLFEVGPTAHGAAGEVPLSWRDLTAWQELTGIELEPWEARLLVALSEAYASERYLARKRTRPMPYTGLEAEPTTVRDRVTAQFAAMFKALSNRK